MVACRPCQQWYTLSLNYQSSRFLKVWWQRHIKLTAKASTHTHNLSVYPISCKQFKPNPYFILIRSRSDFYFFHSNSLRNVNRSRANFQNQRLGIIFPISQNSLSFLGSSCSKLGSGYMFSIFFISIKEANIDVSYLSWINGNNSSRICKTCCVNFMFGDNLWYWCHKLNGNNHLVNFNAQKNKQTKQFPCPGVDVSLLTKLV